jgi:cytochrome oxidase Cu insertion factor (SCO1/SenC/PrrC family)
LKKSFCLGAIGWLMLVAVAFALVGCAAIASPRGASAPAPGESPLISPLLLSTRSATPVQSPLVSPLPPPSPTLAGSTVSLGQMAPDFSLQREDSETVRLSDERGKTVVLVFYRGQT